jgi:hypothetical protein
MIELTTRNKEALIVGGIVLAVLFITLPKGKDKKKISNIPAPETADQAEITQKENAQIALDAYMTAVENRESTRSLQQLNNELAKTYGLRIYRAGKYYVAKDAKGNEILYGK